MRLYRDIKNKHAKQTTTQNNRYVLHFDLKTNDKMLAT